MIISFASIILSVLLVLAIMNIVTYVRKNVDINSIKEEIEEQYQEYHKIREIGGYTWSTDNQETLDLNKDKTYQWHQKDKTQKGFYETYQGKVAIEYISNNLKEYNKTEEEQQRIIKEKGYTQDQYHLLILKETTNNKVYYYYGFLENTTLYLTNIEDNQTLTLKTKNKLNDIDI